MNENQNLAAYTDGASKGNPGPAGFGYLIEQEGMTLEECGEYIGETTNNVAEYRGFVAVLARLKQLGATDISIYSDSELAVRQINKQYRVKNEGLKPLYEEVMHLLAAFHSYRVMHIPREKNSRADRLANRARDEHRKINRA